MKRYEKLFSFSYVFVLVACILFRVESWPFSDWRVYDLAKTPSQVLYFLVQVENKDRQYQPYLGSSLGMKIDQVFKSYYFENNEVGFQSYCDTVFETLKKSVEFNKMTIQKATVDGKLDLVYNTLCVRKNNPF